jgi:hypothetical protein
MDRRTGSNGNGYSNGYSNGNGNGNGNGYRNGGSHAPPVLERRWRNLSRVPTRRSLPLLPVAVLCMAIGLAIGIATLKDTNIANLQPTPSQVDAFRWAVNRAMSAAEVTQTAQTKDEWNTVVDWWKEAIRLMQSVSRTSPNYELAQEKVKEYQENLAYAQQQSKAREDVAIAATQLWTKGSRRADVLRLQGDPTQTNRYDALCQEVLNYGSSTVNLNNGIVESFEDVDRNLKTAKDTVLTSAIASNDQSWTLGSSKDEVFRVQGTPDRVVNYDAPSKEILHYGGSTIEITNGRVTGYANLGGNLRVTVHPLPVQKPASYWSPGAERNQIFQVQGTPSAVSLDNTVCGEELRYGSSTVNLRNGVVAGYENISNNLSVRATP